MKAIELGKLLDEKTPIEILEQLEAEAQKEHDHMSELAKQTRGTSLKSSYQQAAMLAGERAGAYGLAVSILKAAESFRCQAVLWHGPGHQSKTRCQRKSRHSIDDLHSTVYGDSHAEWRGENGMTGYFDEPPVEDE